MLALGIGAGVECITTTNTFFATAVFVDSHPAPNRIDPARIEAAITRKTKALVPVHLYGRCADKKAIRRIADRHGFLVIEDNGQGMHAAATDSASANSETRSAAVF